MAWLCVNKDGTENICPNKPDRWGDYMVEDHFFDHLYINRGEEPPKRYRPKRAPMDPDRGGCGIKDPDRLSYWTDFDYDPEENLIEYNIPLPAGSIEKLIGRTLTWEDEPVEI